MDLLFWQYSEYKADWVKVTYDKLDKKTQKAIEAFAKTETGFEILSTFANEGDEIGSVKFNTEGENSNHIFRFSEFDSHGSVYGQADMRSFKGEITFDVSLNIGRNNEDMNAESIAVTIGHETFIHLYSYFKKAINAYNNGDYDEVSKLATQYRKYAKINEAKEHDGYIQNKPEYQKMYDFLTQLKSVLNPPEVNNQIKRHDRTIKE